MEWEMEVKMNYAKTADSVLYDRITTWLNQMGQKDGYWETNAPIGLIADTEHPLALALREFFKKGWTPAVSPQLVREIEAALARAGSSWEGYAQDLSWMSRSGREVVNGWRIFPCQIAGSEQWLMTGLLFPEYDGVTEGLIWFGLADEMWLGLVDEMAQGCTVN